MANLGNQPINTNLANATNFLLIIPKLPGVTYFLTKAKVPDVSSAGAEQQTAHATVYHPGDHGVYQDFPITYILDVELKNWGELISWWQEYAMLLENTPHNITDERQLMCDIELIVLNNNKRPTHKITFYDAFPIFIQGPDYDSQVSTIDPISLEAVFRYSYFKYGTLTGNMPLCMQEPTP